MSWKIRLLLAATGALHAGMADLAEQLVDLTAVPSATVRRERLEHALAAHRRARSLAELLQPEMVAPTARRIAVLEAASEGEPS